MIVGFFGVAGVGKTTLSSRVEEMLPNIKAYSASQLIKRFDGEVDYSKLSYEKINSNQFKLISCTKFLKSKYPSSHFVLELHNIIETEVGDIFLPKGVFGEIGVDRAFFIYKDPIEIYKQRGLDNKERSLKSPEDIGRLQERSLTYFNLLFPVGVGVKLNINGASLDEVAKEICRYIKYWLHV